MRWAALVMIAGCSATTADPPPPAAGTGTRFDDCAEDSVPILGGGCRAIGVRECGKGFTADGGGGCTANVPVCGAGMFAGLGEAACHEVMDCGAPPYGDVPSGGAVVYVNGAFSGASDGTRDKPFTTIQAAVSAAPRDATVAIADGVYNESVSLLAPVVLRGRCPSKVEIRGTGARALAVRATAEIRGVALTGAGQGVTIDSPNVKLDQIWVHDTAGSAILVQAPATSVVLSRSLVERVRTTGAYVEAASLRIESSVIRDVALASDGRGGNGVQAQLGRDGAPASVTISGSIVERGVASAALNYGSDLVVEGSLLRDIPGRADAGACVLGQRGSAAPRPPKVTITGSLISGCAPSAVRIDKGELTLDRVVIRDGREGPFGLGVDLTASTLAIRDSFIGSFPRRGIFVGGSNGSIERTVVRDVLGVGIAVLKESPEEPALRVEDCAVLNTMAVGIFAGGAKLEVLRSLVKQVSSEKDQYGDGIEASAVYGEGQPFGSKVTVIESVVREASRAGLLLLASTGSVERSSLGCSGLDLAVGPTYRKTDGTFGQQDFSLDDRGGNVCGCPASEACRAQPTSIEPVSFSR